MTKLSKSLLAMYAIVSFFVLISYVFSVDFNYLSFFAGWFSGVAAYVIQKQ